MDKRYLYGVLADTKVSKQNQTEYLKHTNKIRQEINSKYKNKMEKNLEQISERGIKTLVDEMIAGAEVKRDLTEIGSLLDVANKRKYGWLIDSQIEASRKMPEINKYEDEVLSKVKSFIKNSKNLEDLKMAYTFLKYAKGKGMDTMLCETKYSDKEKEIRGYRK